MGNARKGETKQEKEREVYFLSPTDPQAREYDSGDSREGINGNAHASHYQVLVRDVRQRLEIIVSLR